MTPWGFLSKRDTMPSESDRPVTPASDGSSPQTDGPVLKQKRPLPLWLGLLLVFAVLFLLYLPTFIWLVQSWLHNASYSHGFLIPLVSGCIFWMKRKELKQIQPADAGVIGLVLGAALYIVGFVWDIRYLSAISFVVVLFSLVLSFYGTRVAKSMAFAVGFLVFMIPMPFIDDITLNLQGISIDACGWLLKAMGLPITTTGNLISLNDTAFSIGLPCSGLNTLIALVAFAALYVYLLAGPSPKRVFLFLCSIPIAILANILRITSIVLVAHYYDMEFATGFYHDISNLPVFLLAILLIALIGKILGLRFMART